MPSYWENPLTGKAETPPAPTAEEWAANRPYHLADELSRAEEHLALLEESYDKIIDLGEAQGIQYASKLEEARRLITAAEEFIADLREQAEREVGADLDDLLASSPARRAALAEFAVNAYARYAEVQGN